MAGGTHRTVVVAEHLDVEVSTDDAAHRPHRAADGRGRINSCISALTAPSFRRRKVDGTQFRRVSTATSTSLRNQGGVGDPESDPRSR